MFARVATFVLVAAAIGCSEPTLNGLLAAKTSPSDEMLRQGGALMEIGFKSARLGGWRH